MKLNLSKPQVMEISQKGDEGYGFFENCCLAAVALDRAGLRLRVGMILPLEVTSEGFLRKGLIGGAIIDWTNGKLL